MAKKKKKPQKSKAAQATEATRSERRVERWADRAEGGKHPDRVEFRSRADQSIFEKREDTRPDDVARKESVKVGLVMALIVLAATALLVGMFLAGGK